MLECTAEPYIPICSCRPWMREGMTEEWKKQREERRQNDGVAIKYTAGSEEHAGCCGEAVLRWHISALFLSILVPRLLDGVLSAAPVF